MSVRRRDTVRLDAPVKTPEGYLFTTGNLTKTGVFEYRREDGGTQRELRLPEHVFDPASLASFDGKPLTLEHPRAALTADSAKAHQVGVVVDPKKSDDGIHVRARVLIHNADAVKAVESGVRELSNGYDTDLIPIPGGVYRHPDGHEDKADFLQTNIRGNHTAIVERGRAGASARLDSAGHEIEASEDASNPDPKAKEREDMGLKEDLEKAQAEIAALKAEKADAAKGDEAEKLKGELAAAKKSIEERDARDKLADLTALAGRVAPIVKRDAADLVKLGEDALMREGLKVMSPDLKTDGWATPALRSALETALVYEAKAGRDSATDAALAVAGARGDAATAAHDDATDGTEKARKKMAKDASEAWKKPLGPSA